MIYFNSTYNKSILKEHIESSKEFYDSAKANLETNRLRPFFEDCYASTELAAKSILLSIPDKKILYGKNHLDRQEKFKEQAKLGNVPKEYSDCLNELKSIRSSARYLENSEYKKKDTKNILPTIKKMIEFAKNLLN